MSLTWPGTDQGIALLQAIALIGEFNNWTPEANHWAVKNDFGVWNLFLPDNADGTAVIPHRYAQMLGQCPVSTEDACILVL